MSRITFILLPLLASAVLGLARAQSRPASHPAQSDRATQPYPPAATAAVLATVNGTPIREVDVRLALSSNRVHEPELKVTPEQRRNILEVLIQRELIAQRAVGLGLDANAGYQEKLRQLQAQMDAFRRNELAELFYRWEITEKAAVTEAEARAYFAENAARIHTELHVWQILRRDRRSIERIRNKLGAGVSFEEAAEGSRGSRPKTARAPWDLGFLKWSQIPEAWRDVVYGLEKGETSGVILGPNNRFWILKLVDKRENPDVTFESVRPTIIGVLKKEKIEELREKTDRDLRAKASIVYLKELIEAPDEE